MNTPTETVTLEERGPIRIITIRNEAKRNALTHGMIDQLDEILEHVNHDKAARCAIITGSGSTAFSSGHSLEDVNQEQDTSSLRDDPKIFAKPLTMHIPVIAAVNGYAYGAGFIIAVSCDIRVADEAALFCAPGAKVGLLPVGGQLSRLFRLMPYGKAMELLYTGAPLTAHDAKQTGFINHCAPKGTALEAAISIAEIISANAPTVVRAIKQGVRHAECAGEMAGDMFEMTTRVLLRGNADMKEGVSAFLEKRNPHFEDHRL